MANTAPSGEVSQSSSLPSSSFLLARLDHLRNSLVHNLTQIIEPSQQGAKVRNLVREEGLDRIVGDEVMVEADVYPTLAQSKMDQVKMNVDVEALIKNCEDLLSFSRLLKEAWVFGGLNTVKTENPADSNEEREWREARQGMQEWLGGFLRQESRPTTETSNNL